MFIFSLIASASAGPLQDIAQIELSNARDIHRMVRTAQATDRLEVSAACVDAAGVAKGTITKARDLLDNAKHRDAYIAVHEAMLALRPCADEFSKSKSKSFQIGLKAAMRSSDDQLKAVEAHLAAKPDEKAKEAHADAKKASVAGRAHMLAGETPEAVAAWYTMLDGIFTAVKAST